MQHRRLFDILAIIFLLRLFSWCLATIETPTLPPPLHGEWWGAGSFADYLTMLGGQRFYEEGFVNNYFLPNMTVGYKEFARGWYYYQVPQIVPNSAIFYTHYGPVDSIINGLLRHVGITDLGTLYKIAAFFSVLSLGFWYASASMLFNRVTAFISLIFIGTSFSFLLLMDTIAFYSYEFLFVFGAVFLFLLAERKMKGAVWRKIAYSGAWLLVFLQASSSTEFILWLQVFFIGYLWISRGSFFKGWRVLLFMASAPALAIFLHIWQNAWALGGFYNALMDVWLAAARRTTGFNLATETPFKEFQMSQVVPYLNDRLRAVTRIDFIGIAILLLLSCGIYLRLRKRLHEGEGKQLWAQYKLLLVFLIGSVVYSAIFTQSTVTQINLALRLLLPFLGLLIGISLVTLIEYLFRTREWWPLKALAIVIFLIPMFSVMQFKVMGTDLTPFSVSWHAQPPSYYGRTVEEVKVLTSFVQENTSYGDIVITNIDTGDTGHPYYPHPAYEYLSQRRIEIAKDLPTVVADVKEFERIRQSLPAGNPASKVNLYLLIDEQSNGGQFGTFARYVGELKGVLDTEKWWIEEEGHMPPSERKARFYLNEIDPAQVELGYRKTLDKPPTAPVVDIKPGSPKKDDSLVARITTPSTDPDSDAISYSYAWYRNGVLQPELTTDTVAASIIQWGETWKCVVTPSDGLLDGPSGEDHVTLVDNPPTTPVVDIKPFLPKKGDSLVARITAPSSDPDGEAISYSYAWYKSGVLQRQLTADTVDSSSTEWGDSWRCVVTPSDGFLEGPTAEDQVSVNIEIFMDLLFRVPLEGASIEVSSFNSELENKSSLIDGDAGTYWHVRFPPESHEHWVLVDLGTPHSLAALRVKPRKGVAEQLWDGANAVFQGSNDRLTWASLGALTVDKGKLNNEDPRWLTFPVRSGNGFRYYRLLIKDSGFLSLAEVELYSGESPAPTPPPAPSPTPPPPPTPAPAPEALPKARVVVPVEVDPSPYVRLSLAASAVEVSSVIGPGQGKERVVDGDLDTFWHVRFPRGPGTEWIAFDLGKPSRLDVLRLKPRAGLTDQMWGGDGAVLQGSEDGAGWEDLVTLRVQWENLVTMPEEEAWSERWLGFVPGEERSFRYYRIEISDPRFLSLAEVELYSGESPAPTHPPAPSPTPPPPPTPASAPEPTPGLLTPAESNDGSFESWAARDGVLPE